MILKQKWQVMHPDVTTYIKAPISKLLLAKHKSRLKSCEKPVRKTQ